MDPNLQRHHLIDIREAWPDEAQDFTPWLAKKANLDTLGEALGLQLDNPGTEIAIGRYSADVVCNVTGDDEARVVIENQLTGSDHSHLGQTLTYVAELEPVAAVWVAGSFTDEHKKTIEWLNESTHDKLMFFAVTVEVLQIGEGDNAPRTARFDVVGHPSSWTREIRKTIVNRRPTKLSPLQQRQRDFWTRLREELDERQVTFSKPNPQPLNTLTFATGRANFQFLTKTDTWSKEISVSLYLTGPNATVNYESLKRQSGEIEGDFGSELIWEPGAAANVYYVSVKNLDCDLENEGDWEDQIEWLADNLCKFDSVFRTKIGEL